MKRGRLIRLKLDAGLRRQADGTKYDNFLFWGRISGSKSNYYLALALKFDSYEFPLKKFFYSTDYYEFKPLPPVIAQFKDMVEQHNGEFSGDPNKILWADETEPTDNQQSQDAPNDDGDAQKPPQDKSIEESEDEDNKKEVLLKKFTEADRLAYVVRAIEMECAVVPVGGIRLNPKHMLEYNKLFQGLDLNQALNINNWMHFRQPLYQEKRKELEKAEAIFRKDLLDDLSHDLPKECWTIQSDLAMQLVTIRSLKWHGFVGFHRIKTNDFGYCYFGDGSKNVELSLLI